MVFVKVRETYDLHTVRDKMSLIGIHTPASGIIKRNYPGLLMQCKGYRPVSCDVRMACASLMPLSVKEVGISADDVAPEDVFNPILYKACSNWSMSQIEQYMERNTDIGDSVAFNNGGVTPPGTEGRDDFDLYYGLLSQTHEWKHANPQSGLSMTDLRPLVYETYQNYGQNSISGATDIPALSAADAIVSNSVPIQSFRGRPHELPMLNTTSVPTSSLASREAGFSDIPRNAETDVPEVKVFCGMIIVPPSRLHQLFYRLVCEWTIEFSQIRSLTDITTFAGLAFNGQYAYYRSYDYGESKALVEHTDMIDTSSDSEIKKVM